jgi:hypothetical protein
VFLACLLFLLEFFSSAAWLWEMAGWIWLCYRLKVVSSGDVLILMLLDAEHHDHAVGHVMRDAARSCSLPLELADANCRDSAWNMLDVGSGIIQDDRHIRLPCPRINPICCCIEGWMDQIQ